jgi:aminopeptidase N
MPKLDDYTPPAFAIDDVRLEFDLEPERTQVRAALRMRRVGAADATLKLDGRKFELAAARLDGRRLSPDEYVVDGESFTLAIPAPDTFKIEFDTILDPSANTELEGLYVSGGRFCTQCESEGFRRITYFLDRPDVLTRYTVRVAADRKRCPTLLSNGDLIESGALEGDRHFTVWHDPHPKPSYLFALVGGEFETLHDTFTTMSGKEVALAFHVELGDGRRAAFALDALKRSMRWDEEVFQREYDLSQFHVVAVRDFNYGAMENKSLNVFNASALLADTETESDADFAYVERVIAHEYFHNWTGNRITLRDWFQLCLKEGLTVYRDQEFTADQNSRPVQRIRDVESLRAIQFPEDSGLLAHPVRPAAFERIENFYTPTIYRKGAELVRVLSAILGSQAFHEGMQHYFEKHDGQAVTVEDFIRCFEETSGRDLSGFMRWYTQPGTPHVSVKHAFDPNAKRMTLSVSQTLREVKGYAPPKPLPIPLKVGFLATSDGREIAARLGGQAALKREHEFVLEQPALDLVFEDVEENAVPTVMRGFMAPVELDDGLSHDERLLQMSHDPDSFTRWDAGRKLLLDAIVALAESRSNDGPPTDKLISALGIELERAEQDPAFTAYALTVPPLGELMQHADRPDPDALYLAREHLRAEISRKLEAPLLQVLDDRRGDGASRSAQAQGLRALRGSSMSLLAAQGPKHSKRLSAAFGSATNMTDSLGALRALGACGTADFDAALAAFEARWRTEPLVMDKWFSVQAAAPHGDVLARIRRLIGHELFSIRNPNRARAVYAVFGSSNLRAFHAADGSGYDLIAKAIVEVDAFNPLLAGRFVRLFESNHRLDEDRKTITQKILHELYNPALLSRSVTELISKLLDL